MGPNPFGRLPLPLPRAAGKRGAQGEGAGLPSGSAPLGARVPPADPSRDSPTQPGAMLRCREILGAGDRDQVQMEGVISGPGARPLRSLAPFAPPQPHQQGR